MLVRSGRVRRRVLGILLALFPALVLVVVNGGPASAHGAPMAPGSRTFLCWQDGNSATGEMQPKNPACAAAAASGGLTAFYNWFGVLRSDGAGRTRGFIPDGKLCSGGNPTFSGFDLARDDWPLTHLTSGASYAFAYNAWAAHPGSFYLYVTKDGFDPTKPLAWDDLESSPFLTVTQPPMTGSVGTVDGKYSWTGKLPSGKSGRHIIYTVWSRSDSTETFYSCSDVVFDGGNGQVTGLGTGGNPTPTVTPTTSTPVPTTPVPTTPVPTTPVPTTPVPTTPVPTTPVPTTPTTNAPACSATYRTASSWSNGYQGEVTVKNTGSVALRSWMVHFSLPSGQTVANAWNATVAKDGASMTASSLGWNSSLTAGATTSFGFTVNGSPAPSGSAFSCMPS